jgi:Flp pilus assembly protein TadG
MKRVACAFWRNEGAAVAPTIALVLAALIALGGIAFDYARMAGLDTELQNAADQAALAAAGQLDGEDGARARATQAAQALVSNLTYFANDGGDTGVAVATVTFYRDYDAATGAKGPVATTDEEANYVLVTVGARTANYALTPVVAAFSSGAMEASAFAGLGSAICNTPPVMMCNPSEPFGNTDEDYPFDADALRGVGLRAIAGNSMTPGNFGFLETGFGSGASNLSRALGYNSPPGECAPINGVTTKPGLNASVIDALNTRFDISANGAAACPAGGTCSPSTNVRKDLIHGNGANSCGSTGQQGWQEPPSPYRPTTAAPITANYPNTMGHPRDMCHAVSYAGVCIDGHIGDGNWDRDAYFQVNYGWTSAAIWQAQTGLGANATRYEVYEWELAHSSYLSGNQTWTGSGNLHGNATPVCRSPGVTPGPTQVDRRRISAAVINCRAQGLNGSESDVPVLRWIDFFLVEPSWRRDSGNRTEATDIYVEVIGETVSGANGATGGQVLRRDVPRLIE